MLEYKGADGVELDRVLNALEAARRVPTTAAAVALVSEVLHNAEAIARIKPPAVEAEVWAKAALLAGPTGGRALLAEAGLPALRCDQGGTEALNDMEAFLT